MKVAVLVVGRAGPLYAAAIEEYERRAARYWSLEAVEVREEKARRGATDEAIRTAEAQRLLERVPAGCRVVALSRGGESWSSTRLADWLSGLAVAGEAGAAFLIGGALGLSAEAVAGARHRLSLSSMTLPHELARLVLAEQLYRAGTIVRNEPYHKGAE